MRFKLDLRLVASCVLVFVFGFTSGLQASGQDPALEKSLAFSKTVHAFKTVDQLKIQADVYRHEDDAARPVIVWLHGGALIMGSRQGVPKQLLELAQEQGFILVSLD